MSAVSSAVLASRSFRASISFERKSSTVSRSMASLSDDGPEDALALLLAAGAQLRRECLKVRAILGEMDVEHHVAVDDLAAMDGEARLEGLGVEERVRGLRLPERGQHLGVEPMRIARLRADAVANALPVVFCRRRDPVAVVAVANLVAPPQAGAARPSPRRAGSRRRRRDGARLQCSPPCGERSSRTAAGRSPSRPAAPAGVQAPSRWLRSSRGPRSQCCPRRGRRPGRAGPRSRAAGRQG